MFKTAKPDFIDEHISLRRRVDHLLTGATRIPGYEGVYGLNTPWHRLTPAPFWEYTDPGSYVRWRIRSDVTYLNTVGEGGLTPFSGLGWPTEPALWIPGKPHVGWPSYRVNLYCLTTEGGECLMTVKPGGAVTFTQPNTGRVLIPGSCSWPRG